MMDINSSSKSININALYLKLIIIVCQYYYDIVYDVV